MKILLSPAKTLDESPMTFESATKPLLAKQSKTLLTKYKSHSPKKIQTAMKLSSNLAKTTHHRFQNHHKLKAKPALFLFDGPVYRKLDAKTLTPKQLLFAQQHLRIISGLYGILRPLDLIKPYRLEMKHVSDYWKKILPQQIGLQDLVINLASNEYSSPILTSHHNVLTPIFKEKKGDSYKTIAVLAKQARGLMARWIIQKNITKVAKLKEFNLEGYQFDPLQSNLTQLVFVRDTTTKEE